MLKRRLAGLFEANATELLLFLLLLGSIALGASISPYFLSVRNLFDMTSQFMELGLMALAKPGWLPSNGSFPPKCRIVACGSL